MRCSLAVGIGITLLGLGSASSTRAQQHEIPQLNSCIKEFYDPEMYKLLTFKNTCTQSLSITFLPKDGSGAGGTMELRPGAKDSVGRSEGKIPKIGSFELFVCPAGYVPLDDSNRVVSKASSSFRCQLKSQ